MSTLSLHFETPIEDAVSKIRFAPHSNNLLISSWDSNLRLYDVDNLRCRLTAVRSQAALLDCCFLSETAALSADSNGAIRRYDLYSGTDDLIGSHGDLATCVGYSDQTCQVVSASLDKTIMFWDMRLEKSPSYTMNLGAEVKSMSLSGFDLMLALGKSVNVYDLRNMETPLHFKESCMDVGIKCISSFPDCRGYAVGSVDGRVALKFLDPSKTNERYAFRCHPRSKDGKAHLVSINDIVFNPIICGTFVTGDNDGNVIAWQNENKRRLCEFPRYQNSVASLSFNHSGELLAVACSYTYQEANEKEVTPEVFIQKLDDINDPRFLSLVIAYILNQQNGFDGFQQTLIRGHFPYLPLYIPQNSDIAFLSRCFSLPFIFVHLRVHREKLSAAAMSDEEHHFESKADAGASKTYPQQAGTIRKNGYIVIKNRPCKVVEVSTSKTGKHGHAKCHFVAIDIFNSKKLEDIVPSSHNCDVPHVNRTDYQLIDISEDGFVSLLTENGNTKDDLRLPTDDTLLTQIKDGFGDGKDLVVTVMSSMGEEQICALKDIGPK
ncbi:mitotic checkpoint protein BUB3.3-like [Mercurialis annua]|uniref:mitotic checkpoint protein BUB3.3-like n=1 Tax=Mercurialis annua TaxID=3986 RepID=UPI0024ADC403|nr:mitotic checkpoint protein BUB3.3-like [Mercurialis annua]